MRYDEIQLGHLKEMVMLVLGMVGESRPPSIGSAPPRKFRWNWHPLEMRRGG